MTVTEVTDDDALTREDVLDALKFLNGTAKDMRRKGYTGTASDAYTRQHARIDAALDLLESLPA